MKTINFFLSIFLFLTFLETHAQKPQALLIGINNYSSGNSLRNPINDCSAVEKKLSSLGWEVDLALNSTSNHANEKLNNLISRANTNNSPSVLIYLSGHGFQLNDDNFLLCTDFNPNTFSLKTGQKFGAIAISDILHKLNQLKNIPKVIIIDACRSNPLGKDGLYLSEGLSIINAPSNTLIAFSTSPGKVALDGKDNLSPYANSFINSLSQFQNCFDVFLNTRLLVAEQTNNFQIPWESNSLLKHFSFRFTSNNPAPVLAKPNKKNTYDYNPVSFNLSNTFNNSTNLMDEVEQQLTNIINSASIHHFKQSQYINRKLNIDELKQLYMVSLGNIQKDNIGWRFRNLANIFQQGYMHPVCRENNGKINLGCMSFDEVFIFYPDYKLAKACAEMAFKMVGKGDVLGDIYRYGRGVDRNYLKAYDIYRESGRQGDEYYEVNINEMTQEILGMSGFNIKKDGSMGPETRAMISKIVPNVGSIGRILSRSQFDKLLQQLQN